jgi:hypothetical protein
MIDPARRNQVIRVTWLDGGRQAQPPPNPTYPRGIDVDCSDGAELTCTQALPYPAKGCGQHLVACEMCGRRIIITATGQTDDPRSVTIACRIKGKA